MTNAATQVQPACPSLSAAFAPQHEEDEGCQQDNRDNPTDPNTQKGCRAVFPGCGIVLITIEKKLIDEIPDLALRCFYKTQPQITW